MLPKERDRLILCSTAFGEDWKWFVQDLCAPNVRWRFFSDLPRHRWQKLFTRPNFLTAFAGLRTALEARRHHADLIISIGPRYAFWTAIWGRLFGVKSRHMVFSFNFPELPSSWKIRLFRFAFRDLDLIRVHSTMEVELYHNLFQIPVERIRVALWSMNPPPIEPGGPLREGEYFSAIGGNVRDYECLLAASALTPEIPMVWIVRPENLAGLTLPPHVTALCNTTYPVAMNYLANSRAMVLPLKARDTPCGHVTLVSAMFLGKAIVVTDSAGISDYVQDGVNGLLCRAGDAQDLAGHMRTLWQNPAAMQQMGHNGLEFAARHCDEALVRTEIQTYLADCGLASPPSPNA